MAPKKGAQCKKAENPCKICLQSVNQKTGLKCSGLCGTWVHYECADYTPGKIIDIKQGSIRVTCPCPDCETRLPKEYRVEKPTCANQFCPANNFSPHCDSDGCPTDVNPVHDNMNQTTWPSVECGPECKKHTKTWPSVECGAVCNKHIDSNDTNRKQSPVAKCGTDCKKHSLNAEPPPPRQMQRPTIRKNERNEVRGDYREAEVTPSFSVVGQMCSTIGLLAKQMNTLMSKMQDINPKLPEANSQESSGGCNQAGPPKDGNKKCWCSSKNRG